MIFKKSKPLPILEQIQKKLIPKITKKYPTINNGGCGIFTYYCYKRLVELGYKPKIVVQSRNTTIKSKIKNYQNVIKGKKYDPNNLSATHFMVELNGNIFDGKNYNEMEFYTNQGYYKPEMLRVALEKGDWNDSWDKKNSPKLKQLINEHIVS